MFYLVKTLHLFVRQIMHSQTFKIQKKGDICNLLTKILIQNSKLITLIKNFQINYRFVIKLTNQNIADYYD